MRKTAVLFGVLVLIAIAWLLRSPSTGGISPPERTSPSVPAEKIANGADQPHSNVSSAPAAPEDLATALNSPASNINADLRLVADILDTFRSNFPRDGNPVGTNVEITAALAGRNALGLALIPRDHPAINVAGELCDRWGTPFFFHQLSGTQMEIRSAGPDRTRGTADDVILSPEGSE